MRPARTLAELRAQFEQISQTASSLIAPLDSRTLTARPQPGSWSAAECLAHLNLTADAFFPEWERAMATAQPRDPSKPFQLDFMARLLTWGIEPPYRLRASTQPGFVPAIEAGPANELLPGFLARHKRILQLLHDAEGKAIDRIHVVSPFNAKIRYTVWSSFCINASHDRRHLWQAQRAVAAIPR